MLPADSSTAQEEHPGQKPRARMEGRPRRSRVSGAWEGHTWRTHRPQSWPPLPATRLLRLAAFKALHAAHRWPTGISPHLLRGQPPEAS